MTWTPDLLPCPFCGNGDVEIDELYFPHDKTIVQSRDERAAEAALDAGEFETRYGVSCDRCGVVVHPIDDTGNSGFPSKGELVVHWNKRWRPS